MAFATVLMFEAISWKSCPAQDSNSFYFSRRQCRRLSLYRDLCPYNFTLQLSLRPQTMVKMVLAKK